MKSLIVGILVFATAAASSPLGAKENVYRPLTESQFKAFDAEYWKLSKCQKDYLEAHETPEHLISRLVELGRADEFLGVASTLLAGEEPYQSILKRSDVTVDMKIKVSMAGLAMYGAREDVLPSQGMRAFGVVRKYTALAIAPACQPSPEFLVSLKVMLDEHF